MEMDMSERSLEAQPDYIKDLHRRLQQEYRRAGVFAGPATDTLGLGLGMSLNVGAPEVSGPRRSQPAQEVQSPRRDTCHRWPREGSPDEGAGGGCGQVRRFPSPGAKLMSAAAAAAPPKVPMISAGKPFMEMGGVAATPRGNVATVAKEVMRLRLMKRQHDDLRAQLNRAEGQLRRLSPTVISQFLSYLEKHLGDPELALHVQEAIANLIECLCAVCKVELTAPTPEALLSSSRRLLRDPHALTKKLCSLPPKPSAEAEGLAPFLLAEVQYRKVREKDVNLAYEALHSWLSAFYFFSSVSEQVISVDKELERQEGLLRRLEGGGQEEPPASGRMSSPAVSPRAGAKPVTRGGFQASPSAKSRQPLQGARGELARSPPPVSGAGHTRGHAAGGSPPGPSSSTSHAARGFGPRGAQSPSAARRTSRPGALGGFNPPVSGPGNGASSPSAAAAAAAQLPRMQSLQSDALLTYLRARKKDGAPPPPGSGYPSQAMGPEELQHAARFQDGIHRRSSAPAFKDWEAIRSLREP